MLIIGKNFSSKNGAGYYSSHQCGSHEDAHLGIWYEGDVRDYQYQERPLPQFTYWYDRAPVCDNYCKTAVILVTGSPYDDYTEMSDIKHITKYDPEYNYSGYVADVLLRMYNAECFIFAK